MGLEAMNLTYIPGKKTDKDLSNELFQIPGIVKISKFEEIKKFVIKEGNYLIDLQDLKGSVSIRIALCNSDSAIDRVFQITKSLVKNLGGYLVDAHSNKKITAFSSEDEKCLKDIYRERQEVFFNNIADLNNTALSSDDLFEYIRQHGIKPRRGE